MSLAGQLTLLAQRMGAEAKAIRTLLNGNASDLSALNTTAKSNIVAAINELKSAGSVTINDTTASSTTVFSSSKTNTSIANAVSALIGSAPAALDTLQEIDAAINGDANFATTMTAALGNRLRVDVNNQALTSTQQTNAQTNLNVYSQTQVGDPTTDFVSQFVAALS